LISFDPCYF
jgi:hypothetical protein